MCTKKILKKIQHRLQTKEKKREKNIAGKRRLSRRRLWRNKGFDIILRKENRTFVQTTMITGTRSAKTWI
jgi:hypothetical protein